MNARAKSFVTIDVIFNIVLRDLKLQFAKEKSIVKKNSCEVLSALLKIRQHM